MIRSLFICGIVCLAATSLLRAQENNTPPEGFEQLFNGEDLDGWYGLQTSIKGHQLAEMSAEELDAKKVANQAETQAHWTVEAGDLVNDGHGFYLTTDREFSDYELWIDYKTVAKADSGIYLKASPQVQIWDFTEAGGKWDIGADKGSGGLWNNSQNAPGKDPLVLADKPFGEWNRFRILQLGARTTVWLNGKLVVDHAIMENLWQRKEGIPLAPRGPIQLQTHGGEIRWRNIFVREVPADEANMKLASKNTVGFESKFNGKDFAGWDGPLENYTIEDGVITCKPHKGGTIYTQEEYGDFVARFEFRLPPGGNNGIAVRYPGSGDTAYMGMCELQVLDNTSEKYSRLDKRQYHGSAYGMVAAHRGYLRPVGEWNFQEVTVRGSTIQVELNGTPILNADLSKVTEFMGGKPHPGMHRTLGHFGFAGHNDPVQFRNVFIKRLN